MQRFALALCRLFAVLACLVCACGGTASASAQRYPVSDDPQCRSADSDQAPDQDLGAESTGSDFAEHDDDDDDAEEPSALLIGAQPQPAGWESEYEHPPLSSAPLVPGHSSLDPRPPRQL